MELKDFIKQTIEQIVDGVVEAQAKINDKGAIINPVNFPYTKDGKHNHSRYSLPQDIEFDIGLTYTEKNGSIQGIGVFLGSINLGKKNDESLEAVAVSKVKFTIPLALPPGIDYKDSGTRITKISGI